MFAGKTLFFLTNQLILADLTAVAAQPSNSDPGVVSATFFILNLQFVHSHLLVPQERPSLFCVFGPQIRGLTIFGPCFRPLEDLPLIWYMAGLGR
jgi:hypothetical protein